MAHTIDTRITGYEPLLSPAALLDELPLSEQAAEIVERTRGEVRAVLDGTDDRLLVIAGPCSVHDPAAALDYAGRLAGLRDQLQRDLLIVMRVYFEKPRTVTGWKGLINDPDMDDGHDVHRGLHTPGSRRSPSFVGLPVAASGWTDHAQNIVVLGDLGSDRRANHRAPGPPPVRLRPVDAGPLREWYRR